MPSGFSLAAKLLFAFAVAALLPILCSAFMVIFVFVSHDRKASEEIVAQKAATAMLLIENRKDKMRAGLEAAAAENAVTVNVELGLDVAVSDYLRLYARSQDVSAMLVRDASARAFASSDPGFGLPPASFPEEGYETPVLTLGETSTGEPILSATMKLESGAGKHLGYLTAAYRLTDLCDRISAEIAAPVFAIDASGSMLASAGLRNYPSANAGSKAHALALPQGWNEGDPLNRGTFGISIGAEDFAMVFRPMYGNGAARIVWIGIAHPLAELRSYLTRSILFLALIGVGALGFSLVSGVHYARSLTRPISALKAATKEIADGLYGRQIGIVREDEIGALSKDFNAMSATLDAQMRELRNTRAYLGNIINSLNSILVTVDRDGMVTQWNNAAAQWAGMTDKEALGRKVWEILPVLEGCQDSLMKAVATRKPESFQGRSVERMPAARTYLDITLFPLVNNCVEGAVFRLDDVTERELVARERESSLLEKETLLREVHHRVKNNLQIISSLLALKSDDATPLEMELIQDLQGRIVAMAYVHESLYESESLSSMDFTEYVRKITASVKEAWQPLGLEVDMLVETESDALILTVDQAVPPGLILNELVTNSCKHAFPPAFAGSPAVSVTLAREPDGHRSLTVSDNGIGLPTAAAQAPGALGITLARTLTEQLSGTIHRGDGPGTSWTIRIPVKNPGLNPSRAPS